MFCATLLTPECELGEVAMKDCPLAMPTGNMEDPEPTYDCPLGMSDPGMHIGIHLRRLAGRGVWMGSNSN